MDLKQIFGTILTIAGAAILVFAVVIVLDGANSFFGLPVEGWEALVVAILGFVFFSTGIGLIKNSDSGRR